MRSTTKSPVEDLLKQIDGVLGYFEGDLEKLRATAENSVHLFGKPNGMTVAWEWVENLSEGFSVPTENYQEIPPKVYKIASRNYWAGRVVIADENILLNYLGENYDIPKEALKEYQTVIEGIREITELNPIIGEVLTKKTRGVVIELEDVKGYRELCTTIKKKLTV